jgi:hypothetical protein
MIPEDGVEAFTEQEHLSGLEYMKRFYGADIMKVSEIVNLFTRKS